MVLLLCPFIAKALKAAAVQNGATAAAEAETKARHQAEIENLQKKIDALNSSAEEAQKALADSNASRDAAVAKVAALEGKASRFETKLGELEKKLVEAQAAEGGGKDELEALHKKLNALAAQKITLESNAKSKSM